MARGHVTDLRTGVKVEKFFCALHVKQNVEVAHYAPADAEEEGMRHCPGCSGLLRWQGYKFQCDERSCTYHNRWGDW
jgi:hypothetical protein